MNWSLFNEFKSSALYFVHYAYYGGKCWGLDLLVRSHSRISVVATRGSFWVVTDNNAKYTHEDSSLHTILIWEIGSLI